MRFVGVVLAGLILMWPVVQAAAEPDAAPPAQAQEQTPDPTPPPPQSQGKPDGKPESKTCDYIHGPFLRLLEDWRKTCGHALCGQVVAADAARVKKSAKPCDAETWLSLKDDMRATIVGGGAVLFGEVHDNPLHHDLRSRVGMSNFPAAIMEQISAEQMPAADAYLTANATKLNDKSLDEFKSAVNWETSGWQQYKYDPLLRAMLLGRSALYAGDPGRDTIKKIAKEGADVVPLDERQRLKLDVALGEKLDADSEKEIEDSHCGMIPKTAVPNMAFAQRYRDAFMADALIKAEDKQHAAVLFAGNGHLRTDRGVPWYLHQRAPGKPVLSIMLLEVEDGKTDAADYVPKDPDGKPAADYIIFTPRASRDDPCKGLEKK